MPHFIVAFRLQDDADLPIRELALADRIHALAGSFEWSEIPSFFMLRAAGTAESLCEELCTHTEFNADTDILMVMDLDQRVTVTRGSFKYPALLARGLGR